MPRSAWRARRGGATRCRHRWSRERVDASSKERWTAGEAVRSRSGREDLNLRPPDPQSGALPGCATPRQERRLSQIYATPSRTEARAQGEQALTHAHERLRVGGFAHAELELLPPLAGFRGQTLLGALERQPLIVEKALDTLHELEIAPAVQP